MSRLREPGSSSLTLNYQVEQLPWLYLHKIIVLVLTWGYNKAPGPAIGLIGPGPNSAPIICVTLDKALKLSGTK